MEKTNQLDSINLNMRRELMADESRKISRETFFMNRRFETLPLDDQNLKIPIQNVSEILEIVGAPTLDVALYNLDQLTSSKQINTGNNQISSLLEQGIIRHLINLLNNPNIDELFKKITVRILGNIASGPQAICKSVVEAGGIPLFVNYLNESIEKEDVQLMEMALWGLGNIAGDCKEYRVILLKSGLFERLLGLLKKYIDKPNEFLGILQHGVWLLSNICRDKPSDDKILTFNAVPIFCELTERMIGDSYILTDISWALLQLSIIYIKENDDSKENNEMIDYFIQSGIVKAINILLKNNEMPILLPSIRILIRIIKGKTILVNKELFNEFFIVTHKNLLDYKMRIVKQEFIRMLKELIKRDSDFINFLWKHSCLILLLKIIKHDDIMVKKEALNLMKYTINSHINFEIIISPMIKNFELIEIFISTLQEKDPDMISDSLDVLFILMKENNNDLTQFIIHKLDQTNGSKILENLQLHKNPKICEKAVKIIEILLKEAELENKI